MALNRKTANDVFKGDVFTTPDEFRPCDDISSSFH